MKKLFIIANWKSNKTTEDARAWLDEIVAARLEDQITSAKEVIVCPPFTLLSYLKTDILEKSIPIKLGSQDVSSFGVGAHTGEISATQIKEFAEYVVIGHSERRKEHLENNEMLAGKVISALTAGLSPIFCVQGADTQIPSGVSMVAFEPVAAIGTGNPDTPENAEKVARSIKKAHPEVQHVVYGGSVTAENVNSFTQMSSIDGVLVGGASLEADKFLPIVKNS